MPPRRGTETRRTNLMKNGIIYYCVIVSLILHLLFVVFVKTEPVEDKKEKEPIAVDLIGVPKWAPTTNIPAPKGPLPPPQQPPAAVAKASGRSAMPAVPSIPIPAAQMPSSPPRGPEGMPGPATTPVERARPAQPTPPARQAQEGGQPGRILRPTVKDLERYAKVDSESLKDAKEDTITLDTDDLMYTSYLQGMKKRIELIWKYPETARRDGLQGTLVIKFAIGKSGRVEGIEVLKSSGYPMLDDAAKQALLDASPFNPLPDSWKKDYFTITGTFIYRLYGMYLR